MCWEWFSIKETMQYHLSCHCRDPTYLVCTICDYKISAQSYKKRTLGQQALDEHIKVHSEKLSYDQCGKLFVDPSRLKSHHKIHKEKTKQCNICSEMFLKQFQVDEHISVKHETNKIHECDRCYRKYQSQRRLTVHIKSVHGTNLFICDICCKGFKNRPHLRNHHRFVHIAEYPYKCQLEGCEKKFKTSTKQRFHERSHTGIKPHKCANCEASFLRSDGLIKHNMTHTGEKPYSCMKCGKGFIQSCNRNSHLDKCVS